MNFVQGAFALVGLIVSGVFFLITIQWTVKNTQVRRASAWLIGFSTIAFIQFLDFIYIAAELYHQWPLLYRLVDPIVVLLPLTAYGYIRELQGDNIFQNKSRVLAYVSPALVVLALDFHLWSMPVEDQLQMILAAREDERQWSSLAPHGNVYLAIVAGLSLFYWWQQKKQGYQGRSFEALMWIKSIQTLLLMTFIAISIRIFAFELFDTAISMAYAFSFFSVYFLYVVLSFTVLPQNTQGQDKEDAQEMAPAGDVDVPPEKNTPTVKQPSVDLGPLKEMFCDLEASLKNGAYKDNELSLGSLAKTCDLTNHQASAAINQFSGSNFYEWVNQYRIAAAKDALEQSKLPVSTICYDVGFNSKSTFYTAFKKLVGCTPTEYRKSLNEATETS